MIDNIMREKGDPSGSPVYGRQAQSLFSCLSSG